MSYLGGGDTRRSNNNNNTTTTSNSKGKSRSSLASQDGGLPMRGALPALKGGGQESMSSKKWASRPSRLSNVAPQRQRSMLKKPPEPLRRAVADCLSASHHGATSTNSHYSEALKTLQDYFANASTVDVGYTVLLEHALAERDRSPPVVSKCVALLKRFLFRYIPMVETLEKIDSFCVNLISECNFITNKQGSSWLQSGNKNQGMASFVNSSSASSPTAFVSKTLVKSLNYVRALVSKHIPKHSFQSAVSTTNSISTSNQFSPSLSSLRTRSYGSPVNSGIIVSRGSPQHKEAAKSAVISMLGLQPIVEDDMNYISFDMLRMRWLGGRQLQSWTPSPVMTDSGGIARPEIDKKFAFLEMGVGALLMNGFGEKDLLEKNPEKNTWYMQNEQLLLPSTVTTATDTFAAQSHLRAIAASKRVKPGSYQIWFMVLSREDMPVNTWRCRPRPLFQYRYYSEQQPLRLSPKEVEEVITAVCSVGSVSNTVAMMPRSSMLNNQTGRLGVDTSDIAASVLIKLVIDMYMEDSRIASPLAFSMLEGMLSSPQLTSRTRAFDLILNLGIHSHLLETMRRENQPSTLEESSMQANISGDQFLSAKGTSRHHEKVENGTRHAVTEFEIWLLHILYESLLFLVQVEEKDEPVWASALSCLMYMICDRGRIQRKRLKGLDIRVVRILLEVSRENSWAEELHSRLIRLLTNLLYISDDTEEANISNLSIQQLDLLGGIEFICEEYSRANTGEEKSNLFAVLFDYALHDIRNKCLRNGKPFPSFDEIQAVATVLVLASAPEAFSMALRLGLSFVGDELRKSVVTAVSRDVTSGRLNVELLNSIVNTMDSIIEKHTSLAEEFSEMFKTTMNSKDNFDSKDHSQSTAIVHSDKTSVAWDTLKSLVHSPRAIYRQNGYSWLVELLYSEIMMEDNRINIQTLQQQFGLSTLSEKTNLEGGEDQSAAPSSLAVQLFTGLLKSKHNFVRCGFFNVLERLLLRCQLSMLDDFERSDATIHNGEYNEYQTNGRYSEEKANAIICLMNGALSQIFLANETDRINILKMCDLLFSQICLNISPSLDSISSNTFIRDKMALSNSGTSALDNGRSTYLQAGMEERDINHDNGRSFERNIFTYEPSPPKLTSKAALLLRGYAAPPRQIVAAIPTFLLYWPLIQLAGAATDDMSLGIAVGSKGRGNIPGGASDIRASLLLLLIGKCAADPVAFQEVGGEEFFRGLLDDTDARVSYYTSAFLLKRMMTEEPENYQRLLYNLVSKAQQSNNEKILENPYLQMRGILHLCNDLGGQLSFHEN